MSETKTISLCEGKYEVVVGDGRIEAINRYGKPWPGCSGLETNNLVLALCGEVLDLQAKLDSAKVTLEDEEVAHRDTLGMVKIIIPERDKFRGMLQDIDQELETILSTIPHTCRVRVCEGGGPENRVASLAVSVMNLTSHLRELLQRYLAEEIYASMITNEQWQSETGDVHENTLRRLASDAIQAVRVFNEVANGQHANANKTSPREEGCGDESE